MTQKLICTGLCINSCTGSDPVGSCMGTYIGGNQRSTEYMTWCVMPVVVLELTICSRAMILVLLQSYMNYPPSPQRQHCCSCGKLANQKRHLRSERRSQVYSSSTTPLTTHCCTAVESTAAVQRTYQVQYKAEILYPGQEYCCSLLAVLQAL